MEPELTCPLGADCVEYENNQLVARCQWYIEIQKENKNSFICAMSITPILLMEQTQKIIGIQSATESFRNAMVKRVDARLNHSNINEVVVL